jgi:hypothetical protein
MGIAVGSKGLHVGYELRSICPPSTVVRNDRSEGLRRTIILLVFKLVFVGIFKCVREIDKLAHQYQDSTHTLQARLDETDSLSDYCITLIA